MVKIPELAEDGLNWKIYCVKFLEVAATYDCLEVLAGRPYEGEDWDGCNALLCCTFMESVPPSIYFQRLHYTAHENFKFLAKRFCDNNPIPHANELQHTGTATAVEAPEKSPMSADAATEQLAHANSDVEDLSNSTKALTQGTEDVNDGNVGRIQDPHTSSEDSVKGTSAKCKETTSVVLKSMPHEMQDQLQDSLQATPYACEQEAVDSVVTAECTNSTAEMAKPTIADVDRTARPGVELASEACGVDEGDGMECEGMQLQQTNLLCGGTRQRSGNATEDIPSAQKLPLVGEWTVCVSGKASDLEAKPADSPIKSKTLIVVSIESEDLHSGRIPRLRLGGTTWHVGDASGPGRQTDWSSGHADGSRGLADKPRGRTDTLSVSNRAETDRLGHSDDLGTYLSDGDTKRLVYETDGAGTHVGTLTGQTDAPSIETNMNKPANAPDIISIPRKKAKPPDSPVDTTRTAPVEPNGFGDHADGLDARMDVQSIGYERETAENETESVSTHQVDAQMRNSPYMTKIATAKSIHHWRKVSVDGGNVYLPWNVPIEVLGRTFAFGEVESRGEAIAPGSEGETAQRAGDGDGDRDSKDDGKEGTTSGGDVDSTRVEAALLAGRSQHVQQSQRMQNGDSPVLPRPSTSHADCLNGLVIPHRRCGVTHQTRLVQ